MFQECTLAFVRYVQRLWDRIYSRSTAYIDTYPTAGDFYMPGRIGTTSHNQATQKLSLLRVTTSVPCQKSDVQPSTFAVILTRACSRSRSRVRVHSSRCPSCSLFRARARSSNPYPAHPLLALELDCAMYFFLQCQ